MCIYINIYSIQVGVLSIRMKYISKFLASDPWFKVRTRWRDAVQLDSCLMESVDFFFWCWSKALCFWQRWGTISNVERIANCIIVNNWIIWNHLILKIVYDYIPPGCCWATTAGPNAVVFLRTIVLYWTNISYCCRLFFVRRLICSDFALHW